MALAAEFQSVVDSLSDDWTDLVLDLRIKDESRYIDAATILTQVNAQPYSKSDWHCASWSPTVRPRGGAGVGQGHAGPPRRRRRRGEMVVRDWQEGRAEVVQMWGRPESARRDFRARRSL